MRHVLTRQQLYDMVWERAVSKVAPELGISDVGLRKICLKHDIPLPDARYRGLVGAGRPARRKPLPALKAGQVDHIVIHAVEPQETAPEVDAAVNARRNDAPVSIPETLHPLVKQSLSVAKQARIDLNGAVKCAQPDLFRIRVHPDTLARAGTFLNRFARTAIARGCTFRPGREGLELEVDGEAFGFFVNQTIRKSLHAATDEERDRQARWDARHQGDWRRWSERPVIPSHDFLPTGEMSLEIEAWGLNSGTPRRFGDRRQSKLEDRVDEMLLSFVAFAAARAVKRDEEAKRERLEELRRQERLRLERLAAFESKRVAWLAERIAMSEERDRLARFVAGLDGQQAADDAWARFIDWTRQRLADLDRRLTAGAMATELAEMEAFGVGAFAPEGIRTPG